MLKKKIVRVDYPPGGIVQLDVYRYTRPRTPPKVGRYIID